MTSRSRRWNGNDLDTYADDLATLVKMLDLKNAIHVGHSRGGGEVARYIGRQGTKRYGCCFKLSLLPAAYLFKPETSVPIRGGPDL
jgi:non-heme chloroperoxidase